jgi:hypothetical protein
MSVRSTFSENLESTIFNLQKLRMQQPLGSNFDSTRAQIPYFRGHIQERDFGIMHSLAGYVESTMPTEMAPKRKIKRSNLDDSIEKLKQNATREYKLRKALLQINEIVDATSKARVLRLETDLNEKQKQIKDFQSKMQGERLLVTEEIDNLKKLEVEKKSDLSEFQGSMKTQINDLKELEVKKKNEFVAFQKSIQTQIDDLKKLEDEKKTDLLALQGSMKAQNENLKKLESEQKSEILAFQGSMREEKQISKELQAEIQGPTKGTLSREAADEVNRIITELNFKKEDFEDLTNGIKILKKINSYRESVSREMVAKATRLFKDAESIAITSLDMRSDQLSKIINMFLTPHIKIFEGERDLQVDFEERMNLIQNFQDTINAKVDSDVEPDPAPPPWDSNMEELVKRIETESYENPKKTWREFKQALGGDSTNRVIKYFTSKPGEHSKMAMRDLVESKNLYFAIAKKCAWKKLYQIDAALAILYKNAPTQSEDLKSKYLQKIRKLTEFINNIDGLEKSGDLQIVPAEVLKHIDEGIQILTLSNTKNLFDMKSLLKTPHPAEDMPHKDSSMNYIYDFSSLKTPTNSKPTQETADGITHGPRVQDMDDE